MHPWLARAVYFALQRFRGEPVASAMRDLSASEAWPLERLLELQRRRQADLVRHAVATVPHYREAIERVGFPPDADFGDTPWQRLPILEKEILQSHPASLRSSAGGRGLMSTTSGSSGTPVAVMRSHRSWAYHHANIFRGWEWFGLRVGDPYAYFWGVPLDPRGRFQAGLKDRLFNRRRCSAFTLDAGRARSFYETLRRRPVRFGYGYPSALTAFANELASSGLDGRALGWRAVVTTAEVLHEHQREVLRSVFGCPVANSYGCAEIGIAGLECEQGRLHVPVETVVVESVPGADGLEELLLTDLMNELQPVIRYRIGDVVRPEPGPCPCGRALPVLGTVMGRAGDVLTLPDGRRVNANLPSYVFKRHGKAGTVREYQFVQYPAGRIELRVRPGPAWHDAMPDTLRAEVREALGIEVRVLPVERIERRGRGKHRDFVRAEDVGEV